MKLNSFKIMKLRVKELLIKSLIGSYLHLKILSCS